MLSADMAAEQFQACFENQNNHFLYQKALAEYIVMDGPAKDTGPYAC